MGPTPRGRRSKRRSSHSQSHLQSSLVKQVSFWTTFAGLSSILMDPSMHLFFLLPVRCLLLISFTLYFTHTKQNSKINTNKLYENVYIIVSLYLFFYYLLYYKIIFIWNVHIPTGRSRTKKWKRKWWLRCRRGSWRTKK